MENKVAVCELGVILALFHGTKLLLIYFDYVFNVHLDELNCLLVGETSHLGVVVREWDDSDSPNS